MGKTLYISDLDGTLLNRQGKVSDESVLKINNLIHEGMSFSVATARTPATVVDLLDKLHVELPVVLMNGVVIYDLKEKKYLDVAYMSKQTIQSIYEVLGDAIKEGFIYTIKDNQLLAYYNAAFNTYQQTFYDERKDKIYKKFVYGEVKELSHVAYLFFMDTKERIEVIYNKLVGIEGLALTMYQDIYNKAYLLEVYSDQATKANGVKKVAQLGKYNEIVCFGDNLNDMPMFEVANRGIAVSNAAPELKQIAHEVIDTNEAHAVAHYIEVDFTK